MKNAKATRSVFAGRVAFFVKTNLFLRNSHISCTFSPLSIYTDPHGGADGRSTDVDIAAGLVDAAAIVDIGGRMRRILSDAGRPQPPPAIAIDAFPSAIRNCIIRRLALSCTSGIEIFIRLRDAKQKHLILRCIAGICTVAMIFICRNRYRRNLGLFIGRKCRIYKICIKPLAKCAGFPCNIGIACVVLFAIQSVFADYKCLSIFYFQNKPCISSLPFEVSLSCS